MILEQLIYLLYTVFIIHCYTLFPLLSKQAHFSILLPLPWLFVLASDILETNDKLFTIFTSLCTIFLICWSLAFLQDGNEVFFRTKRSTKLRKLKNAYCNGQSVDFNSIAFLFDGRRLRAESQCRGFWCIIYFCGNSTLILQLLPIIILSYYLMFIILQYFLLPKLLK